MTLTDHEHGHDLDARLRRTLAAVAATVREDASPAPAPAPSRTRRRRLLLGAGLGLAVAPLAAAAVVGFGPEHVDRMPPADPIVAGSLDGERWWVVDGREIPRCAGHPSGIEVMAEHRNIVGREWNTVGHFFGTPTSELCAPRTPKAPPAASYDSDGGLEVGDGMLWAGALHPDVDEVRVTLGDGGPFAADTFEHEGGTYFVQEVPADVATFTIEYVVDGRVVAPLPGESATHRAP